MASLLGYLGLGGSIPSTKDSSPVRALPASWYTSQEMYELERRAIFSRKWMLITHKLRFQQAGDYLRHDIAGFQFVLSRDREGNIHAFHNVCRHRAFPVVTEDKGTAKIFSCLYHGWSYGLNGKLAKAPGYSDMPGFDKSKNSLFPIHVHIDNNGFIWINLDGNAKPEISWEAEFGGMDKSAKHDSVKWEDYDFDHSWEMNGEYNWKILADKYNECYHSKTARPDTSTIAGSSSYSISAESNISQYHTATTEEQAADGLTVYPSYYFPNASMTISPHFFYIQRFVPNGPTTCSMRYEIYRNRNSSDSDFKSIDSIYKGIMAEDKTLCEKTQANLNSGVFINGEIHPDLEGGSLHFQSAVRELVQDHRGREQALKKQVWPARQQLPDTALVSGKDVDFCSGLTCQTNAEGLAW